MSNRAIRQSLLLTLTGILICAISSAQTQPPAPAPAIQDIVPGQLPDAPSASIAAPTGVIAIAHSSFERSGSGVPPCNALRAMRMNLTVPDKPGKLPGPCAEIIYPWQNFLGEKVAIPLTWQQKGYFALHLYVDPANLLTIAGISAINVAANSHSTYGPGFTGYGKLVGTSLLQDATGEFFGTFAIPSLTHEDPRYYRIPGAPIRRRILHAVVSSYVAPRDEGGRMPNYGTLLAYPITAELSNFYVPGIQTDARSTATRIATGLALDPTNNLIGEFLPDVAKRVHIRVIFVQNILNNIAVTNPAGSP